MLRIAHSRIEINYPVVRATGTNPCVDRRAFCFAIGRIVGRPLKGQQRGTNHFESANVSALDELTEPGDYIVGADFLIHHARNIRESDVVDAQEHNYIPHARLRQGVMPETLESVGTNHVVPDPIATDSGIQNGDLRSVAWTS